jgi:alpha-1,6-mannosyltransferase
LTYTRLPWRPLQATRAEGGEPTGAAVLDAVPALQTNETPRPTAAPDAYADST